MARIRNNAVLDRMAQPYLRRPPGRPPREGRVWCHELRYQAAPGSTRGGWCWWCWSGPESCSSTTSWLITNLRRNRYSGARLLGLYRMRGKAEGHMGELMDVLAPALSSAPRPATTGAVAWRPTLGRKNRRAGAERDAVAAEPAGLRGCTPDGRDGAGHRHRLESAPVARAGAAWPAAWSATGGG